VLAMYQADRNPLIDALRGCSILGVMLLHRAIPLPESIRNSEILGNFIANGSYGVSIFFVISGFLISGNIIRRNGALSNVDIAQFYAMRAGRILPCVALFIIAYFVLFQCGVGNFRPSPPSLFYGGVQNLLELSYGTFYVNGGNAPGMHAFSPMWSLSVEETFYVAFPIICFFLRFDAPIVVLAGCMVAIGPFMRPNFADLFLFFSNIDLLSLGCIAAKIAAAARDNDGLKSFGLPCTILGVFIIVGCLVFSQFQNDFQLGMSVIGFGAAVFLIGASFTTTVDKMTGIPAALLSPLCVLGRLSLPLYVFHVMIRDLFGDSREFNLEKCLVLALLMAFAWCLDRWILEPLNQAVRSLYRTRPRQGFDHTQTVAGGPVDRRNAAASNQPAPSRPSTFAARIGDFTRSGRSSH
jgi:peptidoglycan/LPS O-acetylase OafA/YrhL